MVFRKREIADGSQRVKWVLSTSRISITVFAVFVIVAVVYSITQAQSAGAPWTFTAFGALVIIGIVFSVVRAWLRR